MRLFTTTVKHAARRRGWVSVLLLVATLSVATVPASAQTQTIRGTVVDAQIDFPLPGANVIVLGTDPILGSSTDANGNFVISNVPVGRQTLAVQFIGYKSITLPNVLVSAGKEVWLEVKLEESVETMGEVVVTANADKDIPINDLAMLSARTFDTEEVLRFSGGRNDVSRLASSFAGVSAPDDSRNDIVVRGNSPTALLWRIEGMPIGNVNHFNTLGTTGGPVSALNTNMLRTSDFLTGAFPAEYGNALAAVFDVNFRDGNKSTHEFTGQVSAFTGAELMAEGPLTKSGNNSFLVSYRYGIARFAAPGTTAAPIYQDLNFKLDLGTSPLGAFELYGMWGISEIFFDGDEVEETDLFADPNEDAQVDGDLALFGLNQTIKLGGKTYLRNTYGFATNGSRYEEDNIIRDASGNRQRVYRSVMADDREQRYTFSTQLNTKLSARSSIRAGVMTEFFDVQFRVQDRDPQWASFLPDADNDGIPDTFLTLRDTDETFTLVQPYAQADYKLTDDLRFTAGVHGQYSSINDEAVVEPRAGLSWQFRPDQRLSLAYGLHSQMVPFPILFQVDPDTGLESNRNLGFTRSHHYVLGYDRKLGDSWRIKAETYYQDIFDAPVEQVPSSYSVLNEGAAFVFDQRHNLVNEGTGFNYGVELTVEKFFSKGYYGLLTASVFESRYEGSDGIERSTAFNNNFAVNLLAGKEWKFGADSRHALTFDTRLTTSGGRPYTPIDVASSIALGDQVLFEQDAFSEQLTAYFRWDVKFGVRLNSARRKVSHHFFLDLQNVTNQTNQFTRRYNPVNEQENVVEQIGFFPDILYRIQF